MLTGNLFYVFGLPTEEARFEETTLFRWTNKSCLIIEREKNSKKSSVIKEIILWVLLFQFKVWINLMNAQNASLCSSVPAEIINHSKFNMRIEIFRSRNDEIL